MPAVPPAPAPAPGRGAALPRWCLLLVLVTTGLLTAASAGHAAGVPALAGRLWDAEADRTWSELAGCLLLGGAALLLLRPGLRPGARVLLVWAAVLVVVALDDGLLLHERGGAALDRAVGLPAVAGLRPVDLGELLTWGALGAACAGALGLAHRRADARGRAASRRLLRPLGVLVAVAVGLDLVHTAVADALPRALDLALGVAEAGGELLAAGLLLVTAARGTAGR